MLRRQLLAASDECLVLEAEPRGIHRQVLWDAPQLHWNASAHALQLVETVQATQHVNAEVHTTLAVHHTDLVRADWSHGPAKEDQSECRDQGGCRCARVVVS